MLQYKKKQIEIHIEFNKGLLGLDSKKYIFRSFATHVEIQKPGLPDKAKAKIKIYGLSMATMEELTMLSYKPFEMSNNRISIYAGEIDESSSPAIEIHEANDQNIFNPHLSLAYRGEITRAFANFNAMPECVFEIHAMTGYYPSLIPDKTISYKGIVPLSIIVAALAKAMDYEFINLSCTASLKNPVLSGSLFEKIIKASKQAGVYLMCDDCVFTLLPKILPHTSQAYKISAQNGLIAYPQFHNGGIRFKSFYNNNISYNGLIELESLVPKASGLWRIASLNHTLSANSIYDSSWFSTIYAEHLEN